MGSTCVFEDPYINLLIFVNCAFRVELWEVSAKGNQAGWAGFDWIGCQYNVTG